MADEYKKTTTWEALKAAAGLSDSKMNATPRNYTPPPKEPKEIDRDSQPSTTDNLKSRVKGQVLDVMKQNGYD